MGQAKPRARYSWRVHHLLDGGPRSWLAGVLIGASCLVAIRGIGAGHLAFLVVTVFLYSLREFWLPRTIELKGTELVIRTPFSERREPWERFRGMTETPAGVLLTRLPTPGRLDGLRGVHIRICGVDREGVLEFIRRRIRSGREAS